MNIISSVYYHHLHHQKHQWAYYNNHTLFKKTLHRTKNIFYQRNLNKDPTLISWQKQQWPVVIGDGVPPCYIPSPFLSSQLLWHTHKKSISPNVYFLFGESSDVPALRNRMMGIQDLQLTITNCNRQLN